MKSNPSKIENITLYHRDHRWKGLTQDIHSAQAGKIYKLTAFMKLLNVAPGHMYEEVETIVACSMPNG